MSRISKNYVFGVGSFLEISYISDSDCLVQRWIGFPKSEEFRLGIDAFELYAEKFKNNAIIIDVIDQKTPLRKDLAYARKSMERGANLVDLNVICVFIQPTNMVLAATINTFISWVSGLRKLKLKYVGSYTDALREVKRFRSRNETTNKPNLDL